MEQKDFLSAHQYPDLPDPGQPTLLYTSQGHTVYWIGITQETAFRCNTYLICDQGEALLIDPGGRGTFDQVRRRVEQIMAPEQITGMVLCHQDPDVAASMSDWLELNPTIQVFSTPRTHVLLPHYGKHDYPARDVEREPDIMLPSGSRLIFRPAPFLHFAGAFVTYDEASGYLFSGDIWAALDIDWQLVVDDFERHIPKMDLFHKDYMASNLAARGFVNSVQDLDIHAILPQHGSIIGNENVQEAMEYMKNLVCGTDLIYAAEAAQKPHDLLSSMTLKESAKADLPLFEKADTKSTAKEGALPHETRMLRESLSQAERLAALRDKALHDLRIAEAKLQQSETKLTEAQRIAHLGHWDWEIEPNRLSWSQEIYRIFGLSPALGMNYDIFINSVHPDDRARLQKAVRQALEDTLPYDIVHRITLPDGEIRFVHEQANVTRDTEGKAVRMFGTVQDITELKAAETALQKAHDELEEKVNLRTKELLEANAKLKELDQLKSMFIATMSHELRTPLNSIIGFTTLILNRMIGPITEKQHDHLNRVKYAGEHLLSLVTDVIDLSKIEAKIIKPEFGRFSLLELLTEAINAVTEAAQKKPLLIRYEMDEEIELYTDRRRLLQCLVNYLDNAVKFSENGEISLKAERLGSHIKMSVADTGIGISKEDAPKLFQPFERLESRLKIRAGGTGLGLYLTKKITEELLCGEVGWESEPEKGSTFWLIIPIEAKQQ